MKTCIKCKIEKDETEYNKARDGLRNECRACQKKYYERWQAGFREPPKPPITHKICTACKVEKSTDEYDLDKRRLQKRDKWRAVCKVCDKTKNARYHAANKPMRNATSRRYSASPHGKKVMRTHHLKKTFNLTLEQFDQMLKDQNYTCKLCPKLQKDCKRNFHIDHCHLTGRIRGLLCSKCNAGLGNFEDKARRMRDAADYIDYNNQMELEKPIDITNSSNMTEGYQLRLF